MTLALRRTFGVELEVTLGRDAVQRHLSRAMPDLPLRKARYSEGPSGVGDRTWLLKRDSSVQGGCELVSPILCGEEGLQLLLKVVSALNRAGSNLVDDRCGLHVHVGDADFAGSPGSVSSLLCLYDAAYDILQAMLPASRQANPYCKRSDAADLRLAREGSLSFERFARNSEGEADRRMALNVFHSKVRGRTAEFRQHSGTTEVNEVHSWVLFCLCMVETCRLQPDLWRQLGSLDSRLRNMEALLEVVGMVGMDSGDDLRHHLAVITLRWRAVLSRAERQR